MSKVRTRFPVATLGQLQEKGRIIAEVKGMQIGVFWVNGQAYAWRNVCPHAAAPVCEGPVCGTRLPSLVYEYKYGRDREIVRCPWHGWEFDLTDGKHLADPGVGLRGYPVEIEGEQVYVLV
ncbi:Rieske (2Fe-2S) protein [Paenibacillus sp. TAB 01]|uniref:Rieske (2Fe-2S) protein n=1 Tax=Paenibacillus sp. TAB 01 TaxID=3368988 RepID=UPI0037520A03